MIRKTLTFQTWCWLTRTSRTKKPWLAHSPSCSIRTETPSSVGGIAVSHHTNISWLFRPGSSYAIPTTCTVASWVFKTSFVAELPRDTNRAITVREIKTYASNKVFGSCKIHRSLKFGSLRYYKVDWTTTDACFCFKCVCYENIFK